MEAPDHAKYIHWGARSQDILDTALVLRLRQYLRLIDTRLEVLAVKGHFADLAQTRQQLQAFQARLLVVRFAGDGTIAITSQIEAALAEALKLSVPTNPPISAREVVAELATVISQVTGALAKIVGGFPPSIHSEVLATMAVFTKSQLGQIHPPHAHDSVGLALEKLALAQICIAGSVALKHAQIMVDQH